MMERTKAKNPSSINVTFLFIILNAILWLAFGLIIAADIHPAIPESEVIRRMMASMSLIASCILTGIFFLLRRKNRIAYWGAIGLLMIISILTISDEFGLADLIVLVITLIPLGLLLKDRRWYLHLGSDPI